MLHYYQPLEQAIDKVKTDLLTDLLNHWYETERLSRQQLEVLWAGVIFDSPPTKEQNKVTQSKINDE